MFHLQGLQFLEFSNRTDQQYIFPINQHQVYYPKIITSVADKISIIFSLNNNMDRSQLDMKKVLSQMDKLH